MRLKQPLSFGGGMNKFMEGHSSLSSSAESFYECAAPACEAFTPWVFITTLWNQPEAEQVLFHWLGNWDLRWFGGSPEVTAGWSLNQTPRQVLQSSMKMAWGEVCGPLVFSNKFGLLSCFFQVSCLWPFVSISSALAYGFLGFLHLGLILVQEKCCPKKQSVIMLKWLLLNTNTQPNKWIKRERHIIGIGEDTREGAGILGWEVEEPLWHIGWQSLRKLNITDHETQKCHFWVYTPKKWEQRLGQMSATSTNAG